MHTNQHCHDDAVHDSYELVLHLHNDDGCDATIKYWSTLPLS